MNPALRKIAAAVFLLISVYFLMFADMQAWLTAADPEKVACHRMLFYIGTAVSLSAYILFAVMLRPRRVWLFVVNTLACLGFLFCLYACAAHPDAPVGCWCGLMVCSLWFLFRAYCRLNIPVR